MKAFFWAGDDGGCGRYRCVLPARALRERGHDAGHGIQFDEAYTDDSVPVVGQRIHNTGSTQSWARWCHEGKRRTVFDADDDYFHMDPTNEASFREYSRRTVRARLLGNAYTASAVTTVSPRLADVFRQYCSRVLVVPNGLPAALLDRPRPEHDVPVVGWVGTNGTLADLPVAWDSFKRVPQWGGVARTVGVPYAHLRKIGMTEPGMRHTQWVDPERYLDEIDFDVWVAPYRPTLYNLAKAPTKALEAAFLGIPIVASAMGPYADFVRHGETGLLVRDPLEWDVYIRTLMDDPQLRRTMGEAARRQAADHTIEGLAEMWEAVLFGDLKGFTL